MPEAMATPVTAPVAYAPAGAAGGARAAASVDDVATEVAPDVAASVIVVSWRVRDLLRDCLRSVAAQARRGDVEVVVVDNASDDGSAAMVREEFPWVRLVENRANVGFGAANDQALPLCRGRHLLLLNPDTVVLDGALDRLVDHLDAHPDVGIVGSRLLNSDGSLQRWTGGSDPTIARLARHYFFVDRLLARVPLPAALRPRPLFLDRDARADRDVDWVSGACLAVRRAALDGRLFDPRFFMYGEDMELCARVRARGWRVVYTPTATVVHHHGQSMKRQRGEILLTALTGPRAYYEMRHGRAGLWAYDRVTAGGFLLRWALHAARARMPGGAPYAERAAASRAYLARAVEVMRRR